MPALFYFGLRVL